jgi:competence protein ComEC
VEFINQTAIIHATIKSDPAYQNNFTEFIAQPDRPFNQLLKVRVYGRHLINYDDYVYIVGKIEQPKNFNDFDYRSYLRAKNIFGEIKSAEVYVIKNANKNNPTALAVSFKHEVIIRSQKYLPKEQAALLISLVTGDKDYLSDYTIETFNASGAAHMIAVSGFNLTMILFLLESLLPYISRRAVIIISIFAAFFCTAVAGFATSMIRASFMSGLFVGARIAGRKYDALRALVFSAAIFLLFRPLIIRYDLSFILSCAGVAGLVCFGPMVRKLLSFIPEMFGTREALISTIAATVTTAPIVAHVFGRFSLIAPLTNIFILPLLTLTIVIGYFCVIPFLGFVIGKIMVYPLSYILAVVQGFGGMKYASVNFNLSRYQTLYVYLFLCLLNIISLVVQSRRLKTNQNFYRI